jgi:hypothetical protein
MFFALGISPGQKWWPTLLGSEISCGQREGPSMHSRCLTHFPFMFWGLGGGEDQFVFFLGSQCVPTMFTLSSQWVPQHVLHSTSLFISYALANCCPPFTSTGGPKGRNSILQNRTFYFAELYSFNFFGCWAIKLAHCKK